HTLTCNSSLPILSFFLIIPHPPISTLFPYTTLFRSQYFGTARHVERRITGRKGASPTLVVRGSVRVVAAGASRLGSFSAADLRQDRKSIRLNSSHSQISYAVFCLKKKKKQNTTAPATTCSGPPQAALPIRPAPTVPTIPAYPTTVNAFAAATDNASASISHLPSR